MSNNFTSEQMLEIARRVYPDAQESPRIGNHGRVIVWDESNGMMGFIDFNPSLTGTDREKAQALDCIVAASKLPLLVEWDSEKGVFKHVIKGGDILQTALHALGGGV